MALEDEPKDCIWMADLAAFPAVKYYLPEPESRAEARFQRRMLNRGVAIAIGTWVGGLVLGFWVSRYVPLWLALCLLCTSCVLVPMWVMEITEAQCQRGGKRRRPLAVGPRQPGWKTLLWLGAILGALLGAPVSKLFGGLFK